MFLLYNSSKQSFDTLPSNNFPHIHNLLSNDTAKDDASMWEFHSVWDDCSHQTSQALDTLESMALWNGGIPSAGQLWRKEPATDNILRWISEVIKKLKAIKG